MGDTYIFFQHSDTGGRQKGGCVRQLGKERDGGVCFQHAKQPRGFPFKTKDAGIKYKIVPSIFLQPGRCHLKENMGKATANAGVSHIFRL